nr:hypothetical protein [uncultured Enterobacter sp.]
MKKDDSRFFDGPSGYCEVKVFQLSDPNFLPKYALLSAYWSKLIQLRIAKIKIKDDFITLCLKSDSSEGEAILDTYLEDVRNVFSAL